MATIAELIAEYGGWGAWFITVTAVVYGVLTGRIVSPREHNERITDLKSQLADEQEEKKFWRQSTMAATEMGAILTKAANGNGNGDHVASGRE